MPDIRVAEIMAALSLTTDLASGMPFEKGLRVCLVADAIAARLPPGTGADDRRRAGFRADVFQAALLRSIGCTAHAPENAALFRDDVTFQRVLKGLDLGTPTLLARQLEGLGDPELAAAFPAIAAEVGPQAGAAGCETSRALAPGLGASATAVRALDDVNERWDGLGLPLGRRGVELSPVARVIHVAEQAVLAALGEGHEAAVAEVSRRAGGQLDPGMVAAFVAHADAILACQEGVDLLEEVLRREPEPRRCVGPTAYPGTRRSPRHRRRPQERAPAGAQPVRRLAGRRRRPSNGGCCPETGSG